ncbi:hypothetical protein HU200_008549 [Digitaria exilis]|uniref:Uncharacterized protein n=1 Tax=Digitaria exilis TaxID=1010633 RepID=A0A835KNT3_9POAL|nr:hypothetical protein HU200_008549 [Digitaria exilis]
MALSFLVIFSSVECHSSGCILLPIIYENDGLSVMSPPLPRLNIPIA